MLRISPGKTLQARFARVQFWLAAAGICYAERTCRRSKAAPIARAEL
jgi:hypothetical protein